MDADFLAGTKAMFVKSVPMDDMNTIVFAIRGTQSFMDWATNLKTKPVSPEGFLVSQFLLPSWTSLNNDILRMIRVICVTRDF